MTMVLDQSRPFGGMTYDHMYSNNMQAPPSFSNPWSHQTSNHPAQFPAMSKPEAHRPSLSMPTQYSLPPTSAPLASGSDFSTIGIDGTDSLSYHQDIPRSSYGEQQYSSPQNAASSYTATYPQSMNYAQSLQAQQAQQQRKMSEAGSDTSRSINPSFGELDASRGMLALSHQNVTDLTPRNIYDVRAQRGSTDSYGFPNTTHSSISNESGRGYPYYASSVGSVSSTADSHTDYSSAASDSGYDPMASRTLPRPSQLMGAPLGPPAPQSMMGQFSSKMSANTQKKHKCKVCDKRFTRPSSLQTHMYSHTGEKPFACNVEGCGRHFSVVSNLRRHKKVHKGEGNGNISDGDD